MRNITTPVAFKSDYLDAALRHCQITVNIGVCGGHTNTCSKLTEEQPTNKEDPYEFNQSTNCSDL